MRQSILLLLAALASVPVLAGEFGVAPAIVPPAFVVWNLSYNQGQGAVNYKVRNLEGKKIEQFWLPGAPGQKDRLAEQRVWTKARPYELQVSHFKRDSDGKLAIETKMINWRGEMRAFGDDGYTLQLPDKAAPLETQNYFNEIWQRPRSSRSLESIVTHFQGAEVLKERRVRRSPSYGEAPCEHTIVDGDGNVLFKETSSKLAQQVIEDGRR